MLEDYLELRPAAGAAAARAIADGTHPDRAVVRHARRVSRQRRIAGAQPRARASHRAPVRRRRCRSATCRICSATSAQMPQILRNFGLDNAILWRGFGGPNAEYWWEAPDGSRVLMMHLPPEGYCNATRVASRSDADDRRARPGRSTAKRARTRVGEVLLMNGVDHVEPHPVIPSLARQLTDGARLSRCGIRRCRPMSTRCAPAVNGDGSRVARDVIAASCAAARTTPTCCPACSPRASTSSRPTRACRRCSRSAPSRWRRSRAMLGARYPAERAATTRGRRCCRTIRTTASAAAASTPVHEENMTRFARAEQVARGGRRSRGGRDCTRGARGARRRRCGSSPSTRPANRFAAPSKRPSICRSRATSHGASWIAQALDAPVVVLASGQRLDRCRRHARRPQRAVPGARRERGRHVRHEPLRHAVGAEARRVRLLFQADVPACGFTSVDLAVGAGQTFERVRRRDHTRRRTPTSGCRSTLTARSTSRTSGPVCAIRGAASSRTSATSATSTTIRRRERTAS